MIELLAKLAIMIEEAEEAAYNAGYIDALCSVRDAAMEMMEND